MLFPHLRKLECVMFVARHGNSSFPLADQSDRGQGWVRTMTEHDRFGAAVRKVCGCYISARKSKPRGSSSIRTGIVARD